MKTEKIEIIPELMKRLDYDRKAYEIQLTQDQFDLIKSVHLKSDKKVVLTFEVPLPEPKREITPSEFDKMWNECRADNYPVGFICIADLKKKLFPEWEE